MEHNPFEKGKLFVCGNKESELIAVAGDKEKAPIARQFEETLRKNYNKEKQIEEMAKIICGFDDEECEHCNTCSFHNGCAAEIDAENIYNAGYRKASEVASNVIDEFIEKVCEKYDIWTEADKREYHYMLNLMEITKDELKKKYTESEKDNGN